MFGFFKRKDNKNTSGGSTAQAEQDEVWGQPSQRKLSKDEAARDAAEQKMIEQKNKERRDMYRLAGKERVFLDSDGRHLAMRTEENLGANPNPHHPPLQIVAFWGVREVGCVKAEAQPENTLRQLSGKIEAGYEGRGIANELLNELETFARQKGFCQVVCQGQDSNEWSTDFLVKAGYSQQDGELVKSL